MMIEFEWDEKKNGENQQKHNISFETSQRVFLDPDRLIYKDTKHSTDSETRWICIGDIQSGIVTVRFTMRDEKIRIFGAGYWRRERAKYLVHKEALCKS